MRSLVRAVFTGGLASAWLACAGGCATSRGESVPPPSPVVASASGLTVSDAELADYLQTQPKLARELYDLRRKALEEYVLDRLVDQAAKQAGKSPGSWLQGEVERQVVAPSDLEIQTLFDTRLKPEHPEARIDRDGPRIREYLLDERRTEALHNVLEGLRKSSKLQIELAPPRVKLSDRGPSKGPATAAVTIVEFSDYECPYCQRQEDALQRILAAYPTQVRLVVRDFPLEMHPDARRAARAAVCADQQGRFWEMHDRLFADPHGLDEEGLKHSARALGLDGPRFDACLASKESDRAVAESQHDAEAVGVDSTPALFLNGRPFTGAVAFEDLKAAVDEELAASPALVAAAPKDPAK